MFQMIMICVIKKEFKIVNGRFIIYNYMTNLGHKILCISHNYTKASYVFEKISRSWFTHIAIIYSSSKCNEYVGCQQIQCQLLL
jgi:hypothetical protein